MHTIKLIKTNDHQEKTLIISGSFFCGKDNVIVNTDFPPNTTDFVFTKKEQPYIKKPFWQTLINSKDFLAVYSEGDKIIIDFIEQ